MRAERPAARMVLMHLLRDGAGGREVLLGIKKRGFGMGKLIAPGGRIEPGESPLVAAVRETAEETGLIVSPADVAASALLDFRFPHRPEWSTVVAVYRTERFTGEIAASDELEGTWWPIDALPLADMWDDDAYWLERALAGERIFGEFDYGPDNETVAECRISPLD